MIRSKIVALGLTFATAYGFAASTAQAAEDLLLSNPAFRMAYDFDAYYRHAEQPNEPDVGVQDAAPTPAEAPSHVPTSAGGCDLPARGCGATCGCCTDCGSECGCGSGCGLAAFSLAGLVGLEGSALDFGGWTQFGYHSNNVRLSRAYNDGLAFNDVPDGLNLHQQWFYLGKEADGSRGFDWGFRADLIYGTDGQKTQAFGNPANSWDEGWDHGQYGWAIPQLYGEVAIGDFSVKAGHFFTLIGYEVVAAPDNFFYSHSLTMFNSEPFTHTGVLASYSGFGPLTLYGGWTLGWDTGFDNLHQGNNWLGGLSLELSDFATLSYMNTWGNFGAIDSAPGYNATNSYSHSVVLDVSITDNLNYIFQTDYVRIDNPTAAAAPTADPNISYMRDDVGINQYLILGINDLFSVGQRIEWWKQDGVSHCESTTGVNVHLLSNLVLRPEYRVDWSAGKEFDARTFGMDAILTY